MSECELDFSLDEPEKPEPVFMVTANGVPVPQGPDGWFNVGMLQGSVVYTISSSSGTTLNYPGIIYPMGTT